MSTTKFQGHTGDPTESIWAEAFFRVLGRPVIPTNNPSLAADPVVEDAAVEASRATAKYLDQWPVDRRVVPHAEHDDAVRAAHYEGGKLVLDWLHYIIEQVSTDLRGQDRRDAVNVLRAIQQESTLLVRRRGDHDREGQPQLAIENRLGIAMTPPPNESTAGSIGIGIMENALAELEQAGRHDALLVLRSLFTALKNHVGRGSIQWTPPYRGG